VNSRIHLVGTGSAAAHRGASGREIALRFNRAMLLVAFATMALIWLMPA
jgi:hypothetical protein